MERIIKYRSQLFFWVNQSHCSSLPPYWWADRLTDIAQLCSFKKQTEHEANKNNKS